MNLFDFSKSLLDAIAEYHNNHRINASSSSLKAEAAADISHIIKEAYEKTLQPATPAPETPVEEVVEQVTEEVSQQ